MDNAASILDGTLEDLNDLPGFKVPPTGGYAVSIVANTIKKVGDHENTVEAKFVIKEVLEVTEVGVPDDQMCVAGDEFAVLFMTDNETGVGFLKEYLKVIGPAVGSTKTKEILEQSKGLDLVVVVKRTYNKDSERHNVNLKKIDVV
jgi:hypothetical protein